MIPYLSYHQDIPVRVIRNRRLRVKIAVGVLIGVLAITSGFAASSVEPGSRLFVVYVLTSLGSFFGFMGYFAYRHMCSVPLELEPCPYCGDFLAYEFLSSWYPVYDLSVCHACLHDFDIPFEPRDMRPGSFETPLRTHGLQGH